MSHAHRDLKSAVEAVLIGGAQKTDASRSEVREDPDNLYAPIRGHDTTKNGLRALPRSLYH